MDGIMDCITALQDSQSMQALRCDVDVLIGVPDNGGSRADRRIGSVVILFVDGIRGRSPLLSIQPNHSRPRTGPVFARGQAASSEDPPFIKVKKERVHRSNCYIMDT
ncbi:hypothetical protein PAECIP111802_01337 [Paenibacillus allorhizosphaerae]|uniref:Uncharacterized protein n=1 Tax=Paenibacillus allorhizosphaerae TaxID=2849866 RepID=A0ABN7THH7_9BACL|nr:hypothetical protein PAECIP111802_01337 [Paenibacillus allorhizosphaerae]